jgi:predicted dehydrogenase
MRIGLAGTGPWAQRVHGPGLAAAEGVDLVGVWGRNPDKASAFGKKLGVPAYDEFDALLGEVDAVAFALPPDVQAELALEAARAGRHLLLDKPVALSSGAARGLLDEVEERGLASVVFFTDRFSPEGSAWLSATADEGGWLGGSVRWLASLASPDNPYHESPWRKEKGALWDIGPHALSSLSALLGPVAGLTAVGGQHDLVHLVLEHESGASSTATLSLFAPPAAGDHELLVWGEQGLRRMPARTGDSGRDALSRAAEALAAAAGSGKPHPAGLALGVRVVELLEAAQQQL